LPRAKKCPRPPHFLMGTGRAIPVRQERWSALPEPVLGSRSFGDALSNAAAHSKRGRPNEGFGPRDIGPTLSDLRIRASTQGLGHIVPFVVVAPRGKSTG